MVVKGTGPRLSPENLLIARIWSPWAAAPIRQGALCSVSLLHAAFYRTLSVNHREPGSSGHWAFTLCPLKEESASVSGRLDIQLWAAYNSLLSPVPCIGDPCPPTSSHLTQHFNTYQCTYCSLMHLYCTRIDFQEIYLGFFFLSCMLLCWQNAYLHRNNLEWALLARMSNL